MRTYVTALLIVAMNLLGARAVHAQEPNHVGVTMAYPSSVGVVWPVADWLALRADLALSQSAGNVTVTTPMVFGPEPSSSSTDSWQVGVGVSALFYVARREALRIYVSPRFAYSKGTTSSSSSTSTADGSSVAYTGGGSFGVQYSLARHIGLFGEVGLGYTHTTTTTSARPNAPGLPSGLTVRSEGTTGGVSTRSSTGVIFFF